MTKKTHYDHQDVEILNTEILHKDVFQLSRYHVRYRTFQGDWSEPVRRDCLIRGSAVAIVLYDPAADATVLVEQFRIGALNDPETPWLQEIPAGMIEPGENPETVAYRETEEETGCRILAIEQFYESWASPGCSSEKVTFYCGIIDTRGVGGIHGLASEGENIRVEVLPVSEIPIELENKRFRNGLTLIGLQWLLLNRERLQEQYGGLIQNGH